MKKSTNRDWFDESNEDIDEALRKKQAAHTKYLSNPTGKNKKKSTNKQENSVSVR